MSSSKFNPLTPDVLEEIGNFCVGHLAEIFPSEENLQRKCKRRRSVRVNYWATPWNLMLQDRRLTDERSNLAKIFCLRFHVPCALFRDILVRMCREKNIFGDGNNHRARVPLEFKLLASLCILGRGNCGDDISELSQIPNSSVTYYFHRSFVQHFYAEFVCMPEGEGLGKVMEMYSVLGFPGALGSMDATHVRLGKCPNSHIPSCKRMVGVYS
jgi:hypothetical protein